MSRDVQKILAPLLVVLLACACVVVGFVWPVQVAARYALSRVITPAGPWSVIGRGWSSPICPLLWYLSQVVILAHRQMRRVLFIRKRKSNQEMITTLPKADQNMFVGYN